jgi:hypothetical protein
MRAIPVIREPWLACLFPIKRQALTLGKEDLGQGLHLPLTNYNKTQNGVTIGIHPTLNDGRSCWWGNLGLLAEALDSGCEVGGDRIDGEPIGVMIQAAIEAMA